MMCKPCTLAADIQTALQGEAEIFLKAQHVAEVLHSKCHDCTCQHKLVTYEPANL